MNISTSNERLPSVSCFYILYKKLFLYHPLFQKQNDNDNTPSLPVVLRSLNLLVPLWHRFCTKNLEVAASPFLFDLRPALPQRVLLTNALLASGWRHLWS